MTDTVKSKDLKVGDWVRYKDEEAKNDCHPSEEYRAIKHITEDKIKFDDGQWIARNSVDTKSEWALQKAPKQWLIENGKIKDMTKTILTLQTNTREMKLINENGIAIIKCGCFKDTLTKAEEYIKDNKSDRTDYKKALKTLKQVAKYNKLEFEKKAPEIEVGMIVKSSKTGNIYIKAEDDFLRLRLTVDSGYSPEVKKLIIIANNIEDFIKDNT